MLALIFNPFFLVFISLSFLVKTKDIGIAFFWRFYYSKPLIYDMNRFFQWFDLVRVHLVCWLVYISYEVILTGTIRGYYSHGYYYLFFYALNIGLFYFHSLVVMKLGLSSGVNGLWKLPILLVVEVGLYFLISVLLSYTLQFLAVKKSVLLIDFRFGISLLWRGLLFILFSTGYYFLVSTFARRKQVMERTLEIERLNSELLRAERDFLRSQINPHLLFNTLNFVKYAAKKEPDLADQAIVRLAELMSFAITETNDGLIELAKEVNQARNLIHLNQLRFGGGLKVELLVQHDLPQLKLIPIVLLTLVENLFKYGNLSEPGFPALIKVGYVAGQLEIETINLVRDGLSFNASSTGTGLINLKARLQIAYPSRFMLTYGLDRELFKVSLCIEMDRDLISG